MKNIFTKLSKVALGAVAFTSPVIIGISSCSKQEEVVCDIESIKLSTRPAYICVGEKLQVHKNIYPVEARNNKVTWEIIQAPCEGFKISEDGVLSAPSDYEPSEPTFVTVKATDATNPDMCDQLSIAFIKKPTGDVAFLGFVGNKIDFYNRDNEVESYPIETTDNKTYTVSKPIDLFIGRTKDAIEFVPVVLKGKNSRMKFHLHGDDQSLRSLAWGGYSDNTWTDEIPEFSVSHVQHRHDCMDITFACDSEIKLHIDFNVWQSEEQETPGVMQYVADAEAAKANLIEVGLGQYTSTLTIPEKPTADVTKKLGKFLIYRKPYEYLEDLTFTVEKSENCPLAQDVDFKIGEIKSERQSTSGFYDYSWYEVSFTYTVTNNLDASLYKYESIPLFEVKAWNPRAEGSVLCYCSFFAQWELPG